MPIQTTTVYSKERLLKFHYYYSLVYRKFFWILLIFEVALCSGVFLQDALNGFPVSEVTVAITGIVYVIGITWVVVTLIVPRFAIKKAKNLNAVMELSFGEDVLQYKTTTEYACDSGEVKYGMFVNYVKNKSELYLFISTRQVWLVDLSALSDEQLGQLYMLLELHVKSKKNKWS